MTTHEHRPDSETGPGPASDEELLAVVREWLPGRRWFPAKGEDDVRITSAGGLTLVDPRGEAEIRILLVRVVSPTVDVVLQVPLSLYGETAGRPRTGASWIGTAGRPPIQVRDGAGDPAFLRAWLAAATGPGTDGAPAELDVDADHPRVISGEQSNTSVVLPGAHGGAILKIFRALTPGENPDVEVPRRLAADGWWHVPRPLGWLEGSWSADGHEAAGHLAVLSEFIAQAADGFELARDMAERGESFAELARDLGAVIAGMHRALAAALPVAPTGTEDDAAAELAAALAERFRWACTVVPALSTWAPAVADQVELLRSRTAVPARQRVHGDLHLGQALRARGEWFITDFEGEPLSSIAARTRPDLALRDVAGVLRSFDYAAAVAVAHADWTESARSGLLQGYAAASGTEPDPGLLRALELDKALYEAVYEARNRPQWAHIPAAALERLLGRTGGLPGTESERARRGRERVGSMDRDARIPTRTPEPSPELAEIAAGTHGDPHTVLGPHLVGGAVTIRTLRPLADSVVVITPDGEWEAAHVQDGVWAVSLPTFEVPDYRLRVTYGDHTSVVDDPYRFLPSIGHLDLHLIGEGRHEELWTVLGANLRTYPSVLGEVHGTAFAVWAPNARAVQVVGDFNHWQGATHAMRVLGTSGVWELFVPDIGPGARYKFAVRGRDGGWHQKADPLAKGAEIPPATASVVVESRYSWQDDTWLTDRASRDPHNGPMSIYEVHLGSWRPGLGYRELATELTEYVVEMGFTHIELMPVAEHPFGGSWGYQVTSYYAPTSRFGHPDDFRHLVDSLHQAGIGVILDWVPAHFPKDEWALARFDGTPLYEHPDPQRGEQKEWGTYVFNFGRHEVRNFLVANATYWFEDFHLDGLRVDAVASMLYLDYSREAGQWQPNIYGGREYLEAIAFLQEANATAYRRTPGVMVIAEESTAYSGVTAPTDVGGLGFGLKWNMGWMNDTLRYLAEEPINRRYHHHEATFSMVYAYSENFVLPISHDEVVHGKGSLLQKMPGDRWQQFAGVRALLAYQWSHPGKQLLFMGCEFAQGQEWAEGHGLDWHELDYADHAGVQRALIDLNATYRAHPALWAKDFDPSGFEWIDSNDADHNVLSYLRKDGKGDVVAVVVNFAGVPHEGYRLALPEGGAWREILNTDSEIYGGSGVGNLGLVYTEPVPWNGRPHSVRLRVPPLGAIYLTPARTD